MPQHLPATPPSEPENKCLGCLFMKLEGIPVLPETQDSVNLEPKSAATEQINLYLTLQFNEQREMLPGGRLKFGLKGGELRIKLENGKIPLTSGELDNSCKLSVHQDRQQQEGKSNQSRIEATSVESKPGVQSHPRTKKTAGKTEQLQFVTCQVDFVTCQVATKGSPENPAWVFKVEAGEPVLKGLLKNVRLGTLNVTAKPCRVEATFEVSPRDVCITEAEGLWPKNISKKRCAVIERAIIRRFLERKLKPYLSRQQLQYD